MYIMKSSDNHSLGYNLQDIVEINGNYFELRSD